MGDIALGSVEKIVKIALKIKESVKTVKQNEEECHGIQRCISRVSALLKRLDETTETMKDEVMRNALEDLAESLEHALELVTECLRKHIFRRFLGAGDIAKELRRVQDDIVRKLQLGNFATSVQTTIMVTNIESARAPNPPSLPPPPPPRREVIDGITIFSSSELKDATKYFSEENIIGSGGSGTIYKGILHDGPDVAIKRFYQFLLPDNEGSLYDAINIFIELNHKNILRPLGYSHEIEMFLVKHNGNCKYSKVTSEGFYFVEMYMSSGSMEYAINEGTRFINWYSRIKMIQGIAQGVHYLHEQHVVHMDLKPSNILLDCDMNPRIIEFGLAKKLDRGDDQINSDRDSIVGTPGYMAPEYIASGTVSTKYDVFGFGVTLLWTINYGMCISPYTDFGDLITWAWEAREAVQMEEMFDPSLCDKSQLMQIKRCMVIGLLCIQTDPADRPTMADVLEMLNGEEDLPALK